MKKVRRKKAFLGSIASGVGSTILSGFMKMINKSNEESEAERLLKEQQRIEEENRKKQQNISDQKQIVDMFNNINSSNTNYDDLRNNLYKCGGKRVVKGKKNMYLS